MPTIEDMPPVSTPLLPAPGAEGNLDINSVMKYLRKEGQLFWDLAVAEATLEVVAAERNQLRAALERLEAIDNS